jgi:hypothetical protein
MVIFDLQRVPRTGHNPFENVIIRFRLTKLYDIPTLRLRMSQEHKVCVGESKVISQLVDQD